MELKLSLFRPHRWLTDNNNPMMENALKGDALLAMCKKLPDVGKEHLLRACGYTDSSGQKLFFKEFSEALLEAKGITFELKQPRPGMPDNVPKKMPKGMLDNPLVGEELLNACRQHGNVEKELLAKVCRYTDKTGDKVFMEEFITALIEAKGVELPTVNLNRIDEDLEDDGEYEYTVSMPVTFHANFTVRSKPGLTKKEVISRLTGKHLQQPKLDPLSWTDMHHAWKDMPRTYNRWLVQDSQTDDYIDE